MSVLNVEWLNKNALRAYPIRDSALMRSEEGLTIPASFLVDAVLAIPFDMGSEASITKIVYSPPMLMLEITIGTYSATVTIADTTSHKGYVEYPISFNGDYSNIAKGSVVIGDLNLDRGVYTTNLPLELRTIRPSLLGVTGLGVATADGANSPFFTGLVELLAGTNITLDVLPTADQITQVRINATETDLEEDCECAEPWSKPAPVTSINGTSPDELGNINLEALDTCLAITAENGTISFEDSCSTPCCGCEELEAIMTASKLLEHNVTALTNQLAEITTQQLNYQMLAEQRSTLEP